MRVQKPVFMLLVPAMLLMLAFPFLASGKTMGLMAAEPAKAAVNEAKKHKKTAGIKKIPDQYALDKKLDLTNEEKDLLARLVHAEAKGEPFKGKVAVAEVVLNRMEDEKFPDTVKGVIYEKRQFDPVANGEINKPAGSEAKKAVDEALSPKEKVTDALFFYNPETAGDKWIKTRPVIGKIGRHAFTS
ncbi:cell wall hydrolase [Bacillus sp. B-jedd]|uniref:cell wall hydrolase n=1 Tax=Bacillus sp. B-jedd TaxID=1476857 RepID=UPI0009E2B6E8|nr:cell wall hydrolase [Bacillus sp. B-jedd]